MRLLHRRLARVFTVVAVLCLSVCIVAPAAVVHAAPPGASAYVPVSPYRILDTRIGLGFSRRVNLGEAFTLGVTGVPSEASAVVLNLTVTAPTGPGFVTVYPTGVERPNASSINVDRAGQTIANLVTVPIGTGDSVDIYSQPAADLIADVQGYYTPTEAEHSGRFVPVNPTRLLDTRSPNAIHTGALSAGAQVDIDVAGLAGLRTDATAAALKVTVTESTASGFWTVFPTGTAPPTVSNLNVEGAGGTIANQVLASLNGGRTTVFSQSGGHLIVDLVGWFTGPSADLLDVGLFVPVAPSRLLDSREPPLGALPGHNRTVEVPVAGRFGLPTSGIGAVVINATVTQTVAAGFFSVWPAQSYRPNASSLNAIRAGQTIANHVITPVSIFGLNIYTESGSHLVVDLAGWYTGIEVPDTPLPPIIPLTGPGGPPPNPSFSFSGVVGGAPLRWNPCQPIRYAINMGGYDESFRKVILEAVERVEAATGLRLVPNGDSTFMPTSANKSLTASASELVIALGDEVQTDLVPGQVVGIAGILFTSSIVKASVVIDMGDIESTPPWSSVGVGPVLMHELAHAVGLGHVKDPTQSMNASASQGGPTTYGAGDLTGLWQVGAAAGCNP
ncbi:MAG: hypothetical protein ABI862_06770 [Ilumatobacteraceae bacterium]